MIETIEELETVFDSFSPEGGDKSARSHRLERMRSFLSFLGNPQDSFRTYHIAGSKGKGSTAAYLAALLSGCGVKCGLYTSPHLFSVRERFTLSGEFFSDDTYIAVCNELLEKVEKFSFPETLGPLKPTTFELYTAYGYMLFQQTGCDAAVIETGLGGRIDATNTITSDAVFITEIELEHQDVLGDTIGKIAREKAGIIRTDAPIFISCHSKEAEKIIRERASEMKAPVFSLSDSVRDFHTITSSDGEHTSFTIGERHFALTLSMPTHAMAENAALAILGAVHLSFITDEGLKRLEKTTLPGRFEKRRLDGKLIVIDTAHTPSSAAASRDAFTAISRPSPTLVLGLVSGKDEDGILRSLLTPFDTVIITKPSSYRKSDPEKLKRKAEELFPEKDIRLVPDPDKALDSALALSSDILITGSFYLVSEMERLRNKA